METIEEFPSDIGTLSEDNVSLDESLTENQLSVADAPAKIPLGVEAMKDRMRKVIIY